jgi:ParB family chromosome partitioning protein
VSKKSQLDRSSVFSDLIGGIGNFQPTEIERATIPITTIVFNDKQPRKHIDDASLASLTDSVKQHGVVEPVLVRPMGEQYELIAGERRTRAAIAAGLSDIPAVILELNEVQALEISVIENLQREDLNPLEETDAILNLIAIRLNLEIPSVIVGIRALYDESRGRTGNIDISTEVKEHIQKVFQMVGRFSPSSFYTNRLPLLQLPPDLLNEVRSGSLAYSKALKLARVKDDSARNDLLQKVLRNNLTGVEIEQAIRALQKQPTQPYEKTVAKLRRQLSQRNLARLSMEKREKVNELLAQLEALLEGNEK